MRPFLKLITSRASVLQSKKKKKWGGEGGDFECKEKSYNNLTHRVK